MVAALRLRHRCLLPSHGRKVRADGLSHQHGLSVRGSVAFSGDGQPVCSRELKFRVSSNVTRYLHGLTYGSGGNISTFFSIENIFGAILVLIS